jgi:hypothetical protein
MLLLSFLSFLGGFYAVRLILVHGDYDIAYQYDVGH